MKITEDVDIAVIVTPEAGDNPSAAGDFARAAFEKLAKKHGVSAKPMDVEHDIIDGSIYVGSSTTETKKI